MSPQPVTKPTPEQLARARRYFNDHGYREVAQRAISDWQQARRRARKGPAWIEVAPDELSDWREGIELMTPDDSRATKDVDGIHSFDLSSSDIELDLLPTKERIRLIECAQRVTERMLAYLQQVDGADTGDAGFRRHLIVKESERLEPSDGEKTRVLGLAESHNKIDPSWILFAAMTTIRSAFEPQHGDLPVRPDMQFAPRAVAAESGLAL